MKNKIAYCCSYSCTGMVDHKIRPSDYKPITNVSQHATYCPHCGYALIWSEDVKNERKKTSNMTQLKKETYKFTNSGR